MSKDAKIPETMLIAPPYVIVKLCMSVIAIKSYWRPVFASKNLCELISLTIAAIVIVETRVLVRG